MAISSQTETNTAGVQKAGNYEWPGIEIKEYKPGVSMDVTRRTLLEPNGTKFEVRYFEVGVDGHTSFERHEHEHCVVVIRGTGKVLLDGQWSEISLHDTVYVGPMVPHQFRNTGVEPFGILCVSTASGIGPLFSTRLETLERLNNNAYRCSLWRAALTGAGNSSGKPAQASVVDTKQSKEDIQHQKDLDGDVEMGKKFCLDVEKTEKLSDNKAYIDRVNRIGQEMAAIAQVTKVDVFWGDKRLNKFTYTFKVIKGPDVNAFTLPGGFIYVYEGLVKYAESDDEIAAVLGHEISHAEQRHFNQLAHDQQKVTTPGLIAILGAIVTRNPELIQAAVMGSQLTAQSFMSTWSIQAEKSADHGGFQYLVHSKYNPTALLTFMERLAADEHSDAIQMLDWGIYKTHPPGRDRAEAVLKDMRENGVPVQRSMVTTRFRADVKPGKDGVDIWFNKQKLYTFGGSDALTRADDAAARLNKFFDQEPNLFNVSFDGKEILGKRVPLIDVQPEDASIDKATTSEIGDRAVGAIRGSLYNYAFSVWGSG